MVSVAELLNELSNFADSIIGFDTMDVFRITELNKIKKGFGGFWYGLRNESAKRFKEFNDISHYLRFRENVSKRFEEIRDGKLKVSDNPKEAENEGEIAAKELINKSKTPGLMRTS